MSVLVTEAGFVEDAWAGRAFLTPDALALQPAEATGFGLDLPNDHDLAGLAPWLGRLSLVRVAFPAMGDGRGFSIARRLRAMGYAGRLRAAGPLIADQFRYARQVGFDEIELPDAVAARQPEAQWRADMSRPSYQKRLMS